MTLSQTFPRILPIGDRYGYELTFINAGTNSFDYEWLMSQPTDPFRSLYATNHERVRRFLVRIAGSTEAEDLTQVTFAKAAAALPQFRGDAQSSTWLYRIAANVASDWLRSRSAHETKVTVPLPDASDEDTRVMPAGWTEADARPSPEQELSQKDMRDCIRREIGKLPDRYRVVFMLNALGGLSDSEIAETLGISEASAKVRLHRARAAFKQLIEARCDFHRNELSCKPTSPDCCAPAKAAESPPPGGKGCYCNFARSLSV
jgi:RNA polymerase sigma-70 factor, ECF subfamily